MNLSPEWVVGFVDGEGCFYVGFNRHEEMSAGYQVLPEFRVVQHKRDVQVLHGLKRFFGAGVVRQNHDDRYELRIRKLDALERVVAFFEKHPLQTKKQIDLKRFARVVRLMKAKEHLTREGLVKILEIAASMNTGNQPKTQMLLRQLKGQSKDQDKDIVHL